MERLIKYFVPENYKIWLTLDKEAKRFEGEVLIAGEAKSDVVKLHAVGLSVHEVQVNGKPHEFEVQDGLLMVTGINAGEVEICVRYAGKLNENMEGAYLSTYEYEGKTETIVATQFESHYAREVFPCVDEPEAKAVFELKITAGADDTVLSNMPELEHNSASRGKTTVFQPTPRMSSYLLAFVVGKFHGKTVTNAHGVEITTYAALNQDVNAVDFANEVAARSLEFYDDNFGVKYPLKKLTQVALPDFEAGAMENWGLVTYRESMLLAGAKATLSTRKSVAITVAHELSHQWFGDLVTMKWWDDLWLNESFASVMEYYAVDAIYPDFNIFEEFFTGDALAALRRDCLEGVQSVHQDVKDPAEIATLFDPAIVYAKGARLMLMVIRAMGWTEFCRGIHEYFEEFQYSNTVGDDLWAALSRHAKFDVGEMMHDFIDEPGYPVITDTTADDEAGNDFVEYKQRRFLLTGEMRESHWLLPAIAEDMSGHYVLNLSDDEFRGRLERFDEMGLEEKLRLLIDRDLVTKTSLASSATLLPLVQKFQHEGSAAVWDILLTIIGGLKVFFPHESEDERRFKKFVGELVRPKVAELGVKTREGDDENALRLRAAVLALDFYAENEETLKAQAAMYNRDFSKIDPEVRSDVLIATLFLMPEKYDEYLAAYKETVDPEVKYELMLAMTLMRDVDKLHEVMKLLEQTEVVKPQDQFYLFIYLYRNPRVRDEVFGWLTRHWDFVKEMTGDKSLENYPRYTAASVRTDAEYTKWREFFEPMANEPALARAIEVGRAEIEARLKLIREDGEAVRAALQ